MAEVIGIRFKSAGKIYHFDPAGLELKTNDCVVVDSGRGPELAWVATPVKQAAAEELVKPLKPVLRRANAEDLQRARDFECKEKEAMAECERLIAKLNLPMKLLSAEYNLDGSHITFFFSAEGRVDFRELVRQLASHFKLQVELRQVGPRDEAKLLGGYGRCGRPLCCMSFLSEFSPVSIRMAKDQDLPLNPLRISGACGRLMCCLKYEHPLYSSGPSFPGNGTQVETPEGAGRVVSRHPPSETVSVRLSADGRVTRCALVDVCRSRRAYEAR